MSLRKTRKRVGACSFRSGNCRAERDQMKRSTK